MLLKSFSFSYNISDIVNHIGNNESVPSNVPIFPQDKFDECKRHLDEAKRILLVTHGGGHSVVKETLESLVQQYNAFAFSTMLGNGSGVKPIS